MLSLEMKVSRCLYAAHRYEPRQLTFVNSTPLFTVWNLYEQICIAALDNGDSKFANECILIMLKKFPDSSRVGRLVGMQNEQNGKYEAALEIYTDLLKKNPANLMVLKRKVCVFKAMGDAKREIEELNALLRQFPAEVASWLELGELYLSLSENSVSTLPIYRLIKLLLSCAACSRLCAFCCFHVLIRLVSPYCSLGCRALLRGGGAAEPQQRRLQRAPRRGLLHSG